MPESAEELTRSRKLAPVTVESRKLSPSKVVFAVDVYKTCRSGGGGAHRPRRKGSVPVLPYAAESGYYRPGMIDFRGTPDASVTTLSRAAARNTGRSSSPHRLLRSFDAGASAPGCTERFDSFFSRRYQADPPLPAGPHGRNAVRQSGAVPALIRHKHGCQAGESLDPFPPAFTCVHLKTHTEVLTV